MTVTLNTPVAPARKRLVLDAASDGRRVLLTVPFALEVSTALREAGATWFAPRRGWLASGAGVEALQGAVECLARSLRQFDGSGAVASLQEALRGPAQPDLVVPLLDAQVMPVRGGGCAFSSLHDPVVVAILRAAGGRYHRHAKAWAVECGSDELLAALAERAGVPGEYVFVHETAVTLEELASPPASPLPISVPGAPPPPPATSGGPDEEVAGSAFLSVLGEPLMRMPVSERLLGAAAVEFGLRDYQVLGVRHLLSYSSALLADDMGLGKTRQAIVAAHLAAAPGEKILVVCPASLRINWAREIAAVRPSDPIAMVGETQADLLRGMRWLIANYERLGTLVRAVNLP
ncbi:MAG TPA: SNF2-related protein, partial [Burkholderiaceae bacterium]|nr:SNF2-related protein [Burkholderiaceae bacterium]